MQRRRAPSRWAWFWPFLLILAGFAAGVLVTVGVFEATGDAEPDRPAARESATVVRLATPSPTNVSEKTEAPRPARCAGVEHRLAQVVRDVDAAMVDYPGTWGFALIDLDCDAVAEFPPAYGQYPASAGKLVPVIAALRAVARGDLDFDLLAADLELVMTISSDDSADYVNGLVSEEEIAEVLDIAGVSTVTTFTGYWGTAFMTPADLAAVWAALLRGQLLTGDLTDYLLDLATRAALPDGYDTFPPDAGLDGFQYGQKAGYWVGDDEPESLVGAGYLRPTDGRSTGFVMVAMFTTDVDVLDPQRRLVFPLLRDFVAGELPVAR